MKLTVIGSGYVGLVAGACFAELGHKVICVDNNTEKLNFLKSGNLPIYEPGLKELISYHRSANNLDFTEDLRDALDGSRAAFIAVGTPPRPTDGHADMRWVYAVAREISLKASGDLVVVNKSTVPVGTGDEVEQILLNAARPFRFSVVSNPEFLREGVAIEDFLRPDRIIVGSESDWAKEIIDQIYGCPALANVDLLHTSRRSAELIKYASNAFLAMKITFINEISDLCEAAGGDIRDVAAGVGLDSRIGSKFLQAGPGYGGSCFPKDTVALAKTARDYRVQVRLVETVIQVNDSRKRAMALRVVDACGGSVKGKTVAILGLAFKADTDDMRESPAVPLVQALQDFGARIRVFDPEAMENAKEILEDVVYADDAASAAKGAEAIVLLTGWENFRNVDLHSLRRDVMTPLIVDLRNFWSEDEAHAAGFRYWGLGRDAGFFPDASQPKAAE